jgi:hypothetical protein
MLFLLNDSGILGLTNERNGLIMVGEVFGERKDNLFCIPNGLT